MNILLFILQDNDQTVRAELHRRSQLVHYRVFQVTCFLYDQRASCNLRNSGRDVLAVKICRVDLRHFHELAASILSDRFGNTRGNCSLSASVCSEDQNVSGSGSAVFPFLSSLEDCGSNLLLHVLDTHKSRKHSSLIIFDAQAGAVCFLLCCFRLLRFCFWGLRLWNLLFFSFRLECLLFRTCSFRFRLFLFRL